MVRVKGWMIFLKHECFSSSRFKDQETAFKKVKKKAAKSKGEDALIALKRFTKKYKDLFSAADSLRSDYNILAKFLHDKGIDALKAAEKSRCLNVSSDVARIAEGLGLTGAPKVCMQALMSQVSTVVIKSIEDVHGNDKSVGFVKLSHGGAAFEGDDNMSKNAGMTYAAMCNSWSQIFEELKGVSAKGAGAEGMDTETATKVGSFIGVDGSNKCVLMDILNRASRKFMTRHSKYSRELISIFYQTILAELSLLSMVTADAFSRAENAKELNHVLAHFAEEDLPCFIEHCRKVEKICITDGKTDREVIAGIRDLNSKESSLPQYHIGNLTGRYDLISSVTSADLTYSRKAFSFVKGLGSGVLGIGFGLVSPVWGICKFTYSKVTGLFSRAKDDSKKTEDDVSVLTPPAAEEAELAEKGGESIRQHPVLEPQQLQQQKHGATAQQPSNLVQESAAQQGSEEVKVEMGNLYPNLSSA